MDANDIEITEGQNIGINSYYVAIFKGLLSDENQLVNEGIFNTFVNHYNNKDKYLTIEQICVELYDLNNVSEITENHRKVVIDHIKEIDQKEVKVCSIKKIGQKKTGKGGHNKKYYEVSYDGFIDICMLKPKYKELRQYYGTLEKMWFKVADIVKQEQIEEHKQIIEQKLHAIEEEKKQIQSTLEQTKEELEEYEEELKHKETIIQQQETTIKEKDNIIEEQK